MEIESNSLAVPTHVTCPNCKEVINTYYQPEGHYFACDKYNCGTVFYSEKAHTEIVTRFKDKSPIEASLPLGTNAWFFGKEYTLVGYLEKYERNEKIRWIEYAFYYPGEQWYIILSEFDGNWMMVHHLTKEESPKTNFNKGATVIDLDNKKFKLAVSYTFDIEKAHGCFDWNLMKDEELHTREYYSLPYVLLSETMFQTTEWFEGRFVNPKDYIIKQPGQKLNLPRNRFFNPATFYDRYKKLIFVYAGFLLLLFLSYGFVSATHPTKEIYNFTNDVKPDTTGYGGFKTYISPPFNIEGTTIVSISGTAMGLNQSWLELSTSLINEKTGTTFEVEHNLEHYSGTSDGEYWSEGETTIKSNISSVPTGTYYLVVRPKVDTLIDGWSSIAYNIGVTQNELPMKDFWVFFWIPIVHFVVQSFRKNNYETKIWPSNT